MSAAIGQRKNLSLKRLAPVCQLRLPTPDKQEAFGGQPAATSILDTSADQRVRADKMNLPCSMRVSQHCNPGRTSGTANPS